MDKFIWGFASRDEVYDAAAAAEQAALDIDPDLAVAWSARARRTEKFDWDFERAETFHKRAVETDPEDAGLAHTYGMGLSVYTDRYDEAIEQVRRSVALEPTLPLYRVDLAEVMMAAGRFDDAAEILEQVAESDPDAFLLYLLRGYLRIVTGQYEEAILDARKALDLSADRRHLEYLACALFLAGRTEEGHAALQEFEQLSKTEYIQEAELGMVYLAMGDHDRA
ncbi:MAG: tetratricopeptide repeat protein, partial [Acidobacteria bacterium]|nr:tetratricopeptide repeat protein [Acidobacteriota bacterium]NIQ85109.1 tetratricopeptide repeat protein [Acidobacteriota bacterium]